MRKRTSWFAPFGAAYVALWWVPSGHRPTVDEAKERLAHLDAHGPTPHAFTLKVHFPPPGGEATGPLHSPDDWTCPV